eukprot:TRINITY_DN13780_c1_g1_i2.p1 TRINITY_DN13780_c1_g1~~TRINITY_DN13780_c1_g1_i2.p1  ORF type:complete len:239 (-),score=63.72 TRINITY_DN13780_c1_g1_i2:94-810(-)
MMAKVMTTERNAILASGGIGATHTLFLDEIGSIFAPITINVSGGYTTIITSIHELMFPRPVFHLTQIVKKKLKYTNLLHGLACKPILIQKPISYILALSCSGLDATDGLGETSDPYMIIKIDGNVIFTTEVVPQTLSPTFQPLSLVAAALDQPLTLECWDFDPASPHDLIGMVASTTLRNMLLLLQQQQQSPVGGGGSSSMAAAAAVGSLDLINQQKKTMLTAYRNSGHLHFNITPLY